MISKEDRKISENLQDIAGALDCELAKIAGQRMGFSLIVFSHGKNSRLNYVSNCGRDDVVGVMETLLQGWSEGMPDIKAHEVE